MGRILAIDYGLKRTGIAVTDPMKMIASPLDTISTQNLFDFLINYIDQEEVETIVVGLPSNLDNKDTHTTKPVKKLIEKLKLKFPSKKIAGYDEKFSSKIAMDAMIRGGMKKKNRQKKENVDKISAAIILQDYMAFDDRSL